MIETILERLLWSAAIALAFGAAAVTLIAGNRWWVRLRLGRTRYKGNVESANATLLYFWSAGCAQCRAQEDQIEHTRAALGRTGKILEVRKLDALMEKELAKSMHVMTVPTTVLLDAGGNIAAWNPGLTRSQKILDQFDGIAGLHGVSA